MSSINYFRNDLIKFVEHTTLEKKLSTPQAIKIEIYVQTNNQAFRTQEVLNSLSFDRNWKELLFSRIGSIIQKLLEKTGTELSPPSKFYTDIFFKIKENKFIPCYYYTHHTENGTYTASGLGRLPLDGKGLIEYAAIRKNLNQRPEPITQIIDDKGNFTVTSSIVEILPLREAHLKSKL